MLIFELNLQQFECKNELISTLGSKESKTLGLLALQTAYKAGKVFAPCWLIAGIFVNMTPSITIVVCIFTLP